VLVWANAGAWVTAVINEVPEELLDERARAELMAAAYRVLQRGMAIEHPPEDKVVRAVHEAILAFVHIYEYEGERPNLRDLACSITTRFTLEEIKDVLTIEARELRRGPFFSVAAPAGVREFLNDEQGRRVLPAYLYAVGEQEMVAAWCHKCRRFSRHRRGAPATRCASCKCGDDFVIREVGPLPVEHPDDLISIDLPFTVDHGLAENTD
jgi:hypothetical protein